MCYNSLVMGKCIKSIALSVIAAVFGVLALSGPVFATPNTANDNQDSSVVTDDPADATNTEDQNETTENSDGNNENGEENSENTESSTSCYDQVGSLGWIICPGAGLFGSVIDGAYNILTNWISTNPLPTNEDSPVYITWNYFKNITNSVFIIFFLIIILSQLTGWGINNYGIKKALPRIVITAILANLSYFLCILAVDLSNVLGASIYGFFTNIQNTAIESGAISSAAASASVSAIVASLIGVGAAAGTVAFAAITLGGIEGIIWMLLPVLLSGVIAIFSAVVTMAARQALIFILVIVAPLAIIAYMLPNTEKYTRKWFAMLFQMLIFYPSFAILYGASQLAGMVIITSADNALGVILGVAVKLLPLFFSIPLMRMSGTVLGKIDGFINRNTAKSRAAFGGIMAGKAASARNKQLSNVGRFRNMPSARLARYLDRKRFQREFDAKEYADMANKRNLTSAMERWKGRDGKYNRRGIQHYQNIQESLDLDNRRTNIETDFDEGFKSDDKRISTKANVRAKVDKINLGFDKAIIDNEAVNSRKQAVALANMEHRAKLIHDNVEKDSSAIHKQVLETFNINAADFDAVNAKKSAYENAVQKQEILSRQAAGKALSKSDTEFLKKNGNTLTAAENTLLAAGGLTVAENALYDSGQKAINSTLSNAISAKRKVDREARSNYVELYDDYEAGPRIKEQLIRAFKTKDYNSMSAALEIMYKRGDKDDIGDVLAKFSREVSSNDDIRFQKELNDICLTMKSEDIDVAQWAKANMMRRGMNGKGFKVQSFIDYESWMKGETLAGDAKEGEADYSKVRKTCRIELANAMSSWDPIATADRTMWNQMLDAQKDGILTKDKKGNETVTVYPIKYLRSAVCSGRMDGERLESFNKWFTGGFKRGGTDEDNAFFRAHEKEYVENVEKFLGEMSANQLGTLKTATLEAFNNVLLEHYGEKDEDVIIVGEGEKKKVISKYLRDALETQITQFNTEKSMAGQRTAMNPAVREMLGIKDILK